MKRPWEVLAAGYVLGELAAGAGISLCIEILQLPFAVRASDIDDLILNTAGVMAGYGIYALFRHIRHGGNKKIISTAQEG